MPDEVTKPDFAELHRKRDEATRDAIAEACEKMGWPVDDVLVRDGHQGCYCDCPFDQCEHEFSSWRELGNGGEMVCKKCGMGAMLYSLRTGP